MVEITIDYAGGLNTRALHGPSGSSLETDAPVDNHGRGERFSPTDLVGTALGSCILTVMGIVAERRGWPLAGTRIRVEKHMVAEPVRRIGRLVVDLAFAPGIPEMARKPLLRAAEGCPVKASLHPEVEIEMRVTWREE